MTAQRQDDNPLPTRLARRRRTAGRLVLGVVCANFVLALIAGFILSGPAAAYTRFRLGLAGWTAALFVASLVVAVPLVGGLVMRLLRLPPEG